ncbi:MAG TPA: tripartite tricarboxylate transporter substrate binding protein [Acetobacteraceae bacterium]|nr:tripartite tricarboxylate transporter substrate binding protein [Acetobacteraceae bacterium]
MIRRSEFLVATLAAAASLAGDAWAQTYPSRPLRMIIPWPPGQATDLGGRIIAQGLSELLGQPVVPENRAGAGGMIGTDAAAKAEPDGYTLLAGSSGPVSINPLLQPRMSYDAERDLAPVAMFGVSPYLLVARPDFPAGTAREFVAAVRAAPDRYTFSSSGTGATTHLITAWFNSASGLQAVHVPFPGSAPALTAMIAGQVDYTIETVVATMPHVRAGRLKVYGVSLARGSALAPGIPPLAEAAGLPGFDAGAWIGVMAPAAVPRPIVDRLTGEIEKAMATPEVRERLAATGLEPVFRGPDAFAAHLREQRAVFARIVQQANIKLE